MSLIGGMQRLSRNRDHSLFDKDVTVFLLSHLVYLTFAFSVHSVSPLAKSQCVKALKSSLKHDYRRDGTFTSTGNVPQSHFTAKMRAHVVSTGLERVKHLGFLQTVCEALRVSSLLFIGRGEEACIQVVRCAV